MYSLDDYDYVLPEERIAQKPAEPRDSSRLMVIDRARGSWEHRRFVDLPEYLDERDVLVANNTRVLKARLLGRRILREGEGGAVRFDGSESGGRVGASPFSRPSEKALGGRLEFVLLEEVAARTWEGLMKASAKYVPGLRFEVPTPDGRGVRGTVVRGVKESDHGTVVVEFDRDPVEAGAGELPLPHYIRREAGEGDDSAYQTFYAKRGEGGSAAAPTAGLHFTDRVLERVRERGAGWEEVTLNVGLGTFRPVKTADIREHRMHEERYRIDEGTAARINEARRAGRRVLAVGTTSVRTLESAWSEDEGVRAGVGRTGIFIYPGYRFRAVDRLLTNFHLPKSSLLMLVSAFAGRELVLAAYEEAVREGYRFFSYGDAMLVK